MRAIVIKEGGGPEVLELDEVPDPEPGEGQVLVRVEAAAVNHFDVTQRQLPLAEAAEAHRLMEAREVFGEVVLRPSQ